MNIDIAAIIEMILELIAQCRENRSRQRVVSSVAKAGPLERVLVRRHLRKNGCSREECEAAMEVVREFNPEDAEATVRDAEEMAIARGTVLAGDDEVRGKSRVGAAVAFVAVLLFSSPAMALTSFTETISEPVAPTSFVSTIVDDVPAFPGSEQQIASLPTTSETTQMTSALALKTSLARCSRGGCTIRSSAVQRSYRRGLFQRHRFRSRPGLLFRRCG